MPMTMIHSLARRGPTHGAALLAACLLMAGCGSSSHTSGPNGSTKTSSTGAATTSAQTPSAALAASLTKRMAKDQPYLKHVNVRCPSAVLPAKCSFTAIAQQPPVKKLKIKGLPPQTNKGAVKQRVAGTIKVIPSHGKTFTLSLTYAPVH